MGVASRPEPAAGFDDTSTACAPAGEAPPRTTAQSTTATTRSRRAGFRRGVPSGGIGFPSSRVVATATTLSATADDRQGVRARPVVIALRQRHSRRCRSPRPPARRELDLGRGGDAFERRVRTGRVDVDRLTREGALDVEGVGTRLGRHDLRPCRRRAHAAAAAAPTSRRRTRSVTLRLAFRSTTGLPWSSTAVSSTSLRRPANGGSSLQPTPTIMGPTGCCHVRARRRVPTRPIRPRRGAGEAEKRRISDKHRRASGASRPRASHAGSSREWCAAHRARTGPDDS